MQDAVIEDKKVQPQKANTKRAFAKLTAKEVAVAFGSKNDTYPPALSLNQTAEIAGHKATALKRKISKGLFADSVSRGKSPTSSSAS